MMLAVREFSDYNDMREHYRAVARRLGVSYVTKPVVIPKPPAAPPPPPPPPKSQEQLRREDYPRIQRYALALLEQIAETTGIPVETMRDKHCQTKPVVRARSEAYIALVMNCPKWPIIRIAEFMNRDHSTVLHALRKAGVDHGRVQCGHQQPPEMLERIQAMRRSGMSWRRIGDHLGLCESTARKWLERAGLKPDHPPGTIARPWKPPVNRSKHTPESDREICRLRAEGRTYPEIAQAVGMARCTIQNRCEHLGVRNHVAAQRKLESLLPAQEAA